MVLVASSLSHIMGLLIIDAQTLTKERPGALQRYLTEETNVMDFADHLTAVTAFGV